MRRRTFLGAAALGVWGSLECQVSAEAADEKPAKAAAAQFPPDALVATVKLDPPISNVSFFPDGKLLAGTRPADREPTADEQLRQEKPETDIVLVDWKTQKVVPDGPDRRHWP